MRADTTHKSPTLTETATPNSAAPAAARSCKINSKRAQATDGQKASPSPPANQDSDVTSVASIGESDGNSDYVKSSENSPMRPASTLELEGHIGELEEMHKATEGKLTKLA